MFGNESKTQEEILKMEPYAKFLRQFDTLKDVSGKRYIFVLHPIILLGTNIS